MRLLQVATLLYNQPPLPLTEELHACNSPAWGYLGNCSHPPTGETIITHKNAVFSKGCQHYRNNSTINTMIETISVATQKVMIMRVFR
jgi:hypothetical protein